MIGEGSVVTKDVEPNTLVFGAPARKIRDLSSNALIERAPKTREELMQLPGIGIKSTNIVLSYGYGHPVISVDVHVAVISRRWHLTKEIKPEKISEELNERIPLKYRLIFNDLLVQFGKEYCRTRYPRCRICPGLDLCPYENKNL